MRLMWGTVIGIAEEDDSRQRLSVLMDDASTASAVCYPQLTGPCRNGDRVVVNTTAVELGLGTGGVHFIVARQGTGEGTLYESSSGGHVLKLRYTPSQVDVIAVESQESMHHDTMRAATSLDGMPVACCSLHSQVPLVAAAIKQHKSSLRVVYCMTDEGALPLALSEVVRASRVVGLLDGAITCGQAFGGDYEAVNLYSGLLAARHVAQADVAIVSLGPGVVGTATPFGHGGIAQGQAINAVAALGGRAVVCLRVSFADERARHRGVSHHTVSALTKVALAPATIAVPQLDREKMNAIDDQLDTAGVLTLHRLQKARSFSEEIPDLRGVRVTTMGRGFVEDPDFFLASFAAGNIASEMCDDVLGDVL